MPENEKPPAMRVDIYYAFYNIKNTTKYIITELKNKKDITFT